MLRFAVQLPANSRPGVALYPPCAIRFRSNTITYEELKDIWVAVTLLDSSGRNVHSLLTGTTADSAHPLSSNGTASNVEQAYFFFPDLKINKTGKYKIIVSLQRIDVSTGRSITMEELKSRTISIQAGASGYRDLRKCPSEPHEVHI